MRHRNITGVHLQSTYWQYPSKNDSQISCWGYRSVWYFSPHLIFYSNFAVKKASFLASRCFTLTSTTGYNFKALYSKLALWHQKWIELQKLKEKIPENALGTVTIVILKSSHTSDLYYSTFSYHSYYSEVFSNPPESEGLANNNDEGRLFVLCSLQFYRCTILFHSAEKLWGNFAKRKT